MTIEKCDRDLIIAAWFSISLGLIVCIIPFLYLGLHRRIADRIAGQEMVEGTLVRLVLGQSDLCHFVTIPGIGLGMTLTGFGVLRLLRKRNQLMRTVNTEK